MPNGCMTQFVHSTWTMIPSTGLNLYIHLPMKHRLFTEALMFHSTNGERTDLWQEWIRILHTEYRVFRSCFHTVLFMSQLCHSSKCYGAWGISIGWASTFISVFRQSFHYLYETARNGVLPQTLRVAQLFIIFSNYFGRFSAERLLSFGMWCCTMCLTD